MASKIRGNGRGSDVRRSFTFEQIVLFRRLAKAELEYERKTYDSKSHGTNARKVLNVKRKKDKSKHIIKDHERLQLYATLSRK